MPRARNEKADEAIALYRRGLKLKDIAKKIGVPEGTVRRWKSCFKWDSAGKNSERSKKTLAKNTERSLKTFAKNTERSEREKKEERPVRADVEAVLENPELNDKQRLFCMYYSRCHNGVKAYQKAYGVGYETAAAKASPLLENVRIRECIKELNRAAFTRALLSAENIFQKHLDIAFADITDFLEFGTEEVPVLTDDGAPVMVADPETGETVPMMRKRNYVTFRDSAKVDGTLIQEVRNGKDGAYVKLMDRHKSLEWLAEQLGIFDEEKKARIGKLKADAEQAKNADAKGSLADVIMQAYREEAPC